MRWGGRDAVSFALLLPAPAKSFRSGSGHGTGAALLRYGLTRNLRDGTATNMLFGKRERRIRRILVVEDEPLVAFDNEYMLKDAGYEVVATVDTLAAAREVIENEPLDLVLTDIKLNGEGDGTGVARLARQQEVPVLFVTGHCADEARSLGLGCLAKPYSDKVLKGALDALDRHLQGKKLKKLPPQLTLYEAGVADTN